MLPLAEDSSGTHSDLFCILFHTPHNRKWVVTLAGTNEAALFQRLDGIAIGGKGTDFLVVFQVPQNWVAAERIGFKLVSILDV